MSPSLGYRDAVRALRDLGLNPGSPTLVLGSPNWVAEIRGGIATLVSALLLGINSALWRNSVKERILPSSLRITALKNSGIAPGAPQYEPTMRDKQDFSKWA